MISSVMSSLSSWSTATQKKRLAYRLYTILYSFHSKKLHIFGFRARIIVVNSRMIFFLSFWGSAWYHFCRRTFPCRLNNSTYWIISAVCVCGHTHKHTRTQKRKRQ
eukprot:Opistho-2@24411